MHIRDFLDYSGKDDVDYIPPEVEILAQCL